jgi:predicted nucleic acid-binding protein
MSAKAFFDTNILVYAFAQNDPRAESAEVLLAGGGVVNVQVLNEFANVAVRKLGMSWDEVAEALNAIRVFCPSPRPLTVTVHEAGLRIARQYGYRIYDALIVAAALDAGCTEVLSEDMRHRQSIEGLTLRNPFKPA